MYQPYNPFFVPNPQQQLEEEEKCKLRKDATFVGIMSIVLTVVAESAFTILVIVLIALGVLQYEQILLPNLGISNTAYMLLNIGLYIFVSAKLHRIF